MKTTLAILAGGLLLASVAAHAQLDEPLEPEKAFAFSAKVTGPDTAEARWTIADGYYIYRDKVSLSVQGGGVSLAEVKIPAGKKKKDEFFGEVEIFKHELVVPLKLKGSGDFTLVGNSQGCNEPIGICYQPLTQSVKLQLAGGTPDTQKPTSLSSLGKLLEGGGAEGDLLDPDQAFQLSVAAVDDRTLRAEIVIAEGYYLYRNKTSFQLNAEGAKLGAFELPAGKEKQDEFFGKTEIYTGVIGFDLPLERAGANAVSAELVAGYQGCAEKGVCYPPVSKTISVELPAAGAGGGAPADTGTRTSSRTYWLAILSAFGVGLLLTFTPCVLPMIPILSSIIVGHGGAQPVTKSRGGFLAAIYVLGTAVTYTAAGVFAGYTGGQLQAYFQNVWAIGIFSSVLVLLALSMFGFYEIQVPSFLQSRLEAETRRFKGGNVIGVFVMGLISALIVGACVSPLLMAALGVAIASKDPLLGGLIMFSMALGMGVILIGIGFGAGFLLPRAGLWMERVKYVFGVLLLGVAIYLISLVAREWAMYLWAALLIITAVYLGALQSLPEGVSGWRRLWKGIGVFMLIWGVLALLGGMSGSHDIVRPLPLDRLGGPAVGVATQGSTVGSDSLFQKVHNNSELDRQLAAAAAAGKPVLIDYYADWCNDCVRMENTTFAEPAVRQVLGERFVVLKINVTDPNDPDASALKSRHGVFGPPATLFIAPSGKLLKEFNFYGYRNSADLLAILDNVLKQL